MPYREQSPGSTVARWVECVWSFTSTENIGAYPVRPDGCIDIIYSGSGELNVVGTMTAEQRFDLPAGSNVGGVRFRPGMATPFLHVPAQELTDRTVSLEALNISEARRLSARLRDANSADHCSRILAAELAIPCDSPNHVQCAIEAITAARGNIDLDWVARQAGMSGRQFRRRCLHETGLTPKRLCRVLRFRHAHLLGQRGLPWSLIAADTGYFDQAHLIRDFREFTGNTPVSVFSNTSGRNSG